jgi:hypothetical protein
LEGRVNHPATDVIVYHEGLVCGLVVDVSDYSEMVPVSRFFTIGDNTGINRPVQIVESGDYQDDKENG